MGLDARRLRQTLDRLVAATTRLSHDGRFVEPNLDGSAGDYISFEVWEWPQGVALYGLVRLWRDLRDGGDAGADPLRALIEGWYARRLAEGLPPVNVNTTAPMLALALLWQQTRDPRWETPLADWAERLLHRAARTPEGGFQHDVSDRINPGELWDDTLFMMALFLAAYGAAAGRRDLVEEAAHQFLVHARYLADPGTGLWYHGWAFEGRHNFARARWARGNAWVTAGLLDLGELCRLPEPVGRYLAGILGAQIEGLLPLQTAAGAWRTLLDDASSYEEISATAGFGYAMMKAGRLGLAGEDVRQAGLRALDAVLANIDTAGVVGGVSYGTRMGRDLQFYREIPLQPTGYGQALAILCLGEALNHAGAQDHAGAGHRKGATA